MKSPFLGMDPYIENYPWRGFHNNAIIRVMDALVTQLPEGYLIDLEVGGTINDFVLGRQQNYRPDLGVIESNSPEEPTTPYGAPTAVAITPPQEITPIEDAHLRTVTIRSVEGRELVTAIEILSPTNKKGADRIAYQRKRDDFISNQIHLVEIDLIRGGKAAYTRDSWDVKTYSFQTVDAIDKRISFWSVGLDEELPTIAVPLLPGDSDMALDLQAIFKKIYLYSTYSRAFKYDVNTLHPKPTPTERTVIEKILKRAK